MNLFPSRPHSVTETLVTPPATCLLALILFAPPAAARAGSVVPFFFGASGDQEVPPVETPARGGCHAALDQPAAQLNITCAHDVVDAVAAHIHAGAPGVSGPVVFDLGDPSESPFAAMWAGLSADEVAALLAGELYVNIHSMAHPDGEVRGQIVEGTVDLAFTADQGQVVPPTGSAATASCSTDRNPDTGVFTVGCGHDVAMAVEAHIHLGAVGVAGPVVLDLGDPTSPFEASTLLLPPELAQLAAGLLYLDIHSVPFPHGEIRGQMVTDRLFADGFESGDTSAWAATVP